MLNVSDKYMAMAKSDTREVSVRVEIGNYAVLTNDDIIELEIYRSEGESGFRIGGVVSARIRLLALMKLPYSGEVTIDVFVGFGFDEKNASEYIQLGRFYGYATNPSFDTAQVEIIGYDKLGLGSFLNRRFHGDYAPEFPCTVQDILDYICRRSNLECDFICNNYSVSELPLKDRTRDDADYEKYYTYKEMLGFIAAAHGAVAAMDNNNRLVFFSVGEETETVDSADCVDFAFKSAEEFSVKGILLHAQDMLSTGSTNIFINDNSKIAYNGETTDGVVEASCPFGSIEIAEELWRQLGGFSYYSCEFTRRGMGWTELGDVIYAVDSLSGKTLLKHKGKMIAQTVEWKFSAAEGFMEHIISKAESPEESAERLGNVNSINNGSGGSGGVGEFTNEEKNSEIFNCYTDVKNASGAVIAKKNYINPNTPYAHIAGRSSSIDESNEGLTATSDAASILGGVTNVILNSPLAVIAGGMGNSISKSTMGNISSGNSNKITNSNLSFVGSGNVNSVLNGVGSAIVSGFYNKVSGSYSGIFVGMDNEILGGSSNHIGSGDGNKVNGNHNAIVSGHSNKILNGYKNVIMSGYNNQISGGSENAIICGNNNAIDSGVEYACAAGRYNQIHSGGNGSLVCGTSNECASENSIVCGNNASAMPDGRIIVGSTVGNVFYVTGKGDVYARSFNIIGAASDASAVSVMSDEPSNLSALTEQINQMKTEIETLKAEIAELKGVTS